MFVVGPFQLFPELCMIPMGQHHNLQSPITIHQMPYQDIIYISKKTFVYTRHLKMMQIFHIKVIQEPSISLEAQLFQQFCSNLSLAQLLPFQSLQL